MLIGYARVSTDDQKLDLQLDALKEAKCEKIFHDTISSSKAYRKGLHEALEFARQGDVLVVWKLDRLGRSLRELIDIVMGMQERGIEFRTTQGAIDTTTPGGKLVFHVFASIAEFERELIRERTKAGLEAARARGRKGGRKRTMDDKKIAMARALLADPNNKVLDICSTLQVSKSTLYKHLPKASKG